MTNIARRIEWLIEESKSEDLSYDLSVKYLMRGLSNYFSINDFNASSLKVKKKNRRISESAYEKLMTHSFTDWHRMTRNEHPLPLKEMWNQLMNMSVVNHKMVKDLFLDHPMATITLDEDKSINHRGMRDSGSAEQRYDASGIVLMTIDEEPYIFSRSLVD